MTDQPHSPHSDAPDGWDAELEALVQAALAGELDDGGSSTVTVDAALLRRTAGLVASASTTADPPSPPASLRSSVLEAIRSDSAHRTNRGTDLQSDRAMAVAEPIPLESRRRWRGRRPFAAVAAAAAIVVGALFTLTPGPSTSVAFATELIPAPNSPSPGATGTAELLKTKHGWVMRLKVKGLAPNPTGAVYQCWYVGPADGTEAGGTEKQDRISVGTFRTKDGTIEVEWPTAANPKRYPKVGITLEPDDGNPLRSGPKVLVGATSAKAP